MRTLSLISAPVRLSETAAKRVGVGEAALRELGPMAYARAKNGVDRFPPGTDPGLMEWFAVEQGQSDLEVMINMQKFTYGLDTTPYLARIAAPTLLVWGDQDKVVPPSYAQIFSKAIVGKTKVKKIKSAGHMAEFDQPKAVAKAVVEFLAG